MPTPPGKMKYPDSAGHFQEFNIESYSLGNNSSANAGNAHREAEAFKMGDITIQKKNDRLSAELMGYCFGGKALPTAIISMMTNNIPYLTLELQEVYITNWRLGASYDGGPALENLTLSCKTVKPTYGNKPSP